MVFVAYYVLMAFKQREPCEVDTLKKSTENSVVKENAASSLTVAFMAGFILHSINFTIGTFFEPCVRLTNMQSAGEKQEANANNSGGFKYSTWFMVGYGADISFRAAFMLFSIG